MKENHIFEKWCTEYTDVTVDKFLATSGETWNQRVKERGLIILKGLSPALSDACFNQICGHIGTLWTPAEYHATTPRGDPTLTRNLDTPVSNFQTKNNHWKAGDMQYHADMAHIGPKSLPARALFMIRTAKNGSGDTHWLNLEEAWAQFTDEEKSRFDNVTLDQHWMYVPGQRIERFPFLKTNPFTGKIGPRMNCYGKGKTWIYSVFNKEDTEIVSIRAYMESIYQLCESKKDTFYSHHWENGDMLIYDNWFSVHKRDPVTFEPGEPDRLLKRLTFNL
jgi:alpha-ketoglutarate-dependent taurine dioxygenase